MTASPFLLPDNPDLAEVLTDAAVEVLRTRGVDQFSVSALARWMKVTPEAVLNVHSRSRVVELVTICFCRRWLRWSTGDLWWLRSEPPVPLRLPRDAEERHGVRVLQALTELAEGERVRGNPLVGSHLSRLRDDEATVLRARLRELDPQRVEGATDPTLRGLLALVHGLRCSVAQPGSRLSAEDASVVLHAAVSSARSPDPGAPTRGPHPHPPHAPAA